MSITRAQIARQLLNSIAPKGEKLAYINKKEAKLLKKKGGAGIDVNGTGIKSYFDPGVGAGSVSESLSEAAGVGSGYSGGNSGDNGDSGSGGNFATINRGPRTVSPTRDEAIQNPFGITRVNRNFIAPNAAVNRRPPPTEFIEEEETLLDKGIGYGKDLAKTYAKNTALTALGISNPFGLTGMALTSLFNRAKEDKAKRDSIDAKTANARLSGSFTTAFNPTRTTGPGPIIDGGGDNMPMPMMPFRSPELPSDIESRPSDFDLYAALEGREAMNFGMNPNNMMGAMQRFSDGGEVRQAYGLGSLVKKFKRGVKKVGRGIKKFAKSDLGKAALLYAGGTYLGGMKAFGGSGIGGKAGLKKFGFENFGKRLFSPTGTDGFSNIFNPLRSAAENFKLPFAQTEEAKQAALEGKLEKIASSKLSDEGKKKLSDKLISETLGIGGSKTPALVKYGIPAAMAASYLFTKNEEPDNLDEEMMKNYKDTSGLKEQIASYPEYRFQVPEQYRLADGGRIGYDMGGDVEMASYGYDDAMNETRELFMQYKKSGIVPMEMEFEEFLELLQGSKQKEEPNRVMAQEGGIMNLGGLEKDYREGGFVPIGEYEKKDDVPARLSKNEFVFTADAVRAAGGGSVDKGADLMYKTMKNLESRVG